MRRWFWLFFVPMTALAAESNFASIQILFGERDFLNGPTRKYRSVVRGSHQRRVASVEKAR